VNGPATGGQTAASTSRRRVVIACSAALSAITGVISYQHGLDVVRWAGNTGLVAYLVPLVPDLMIVTSSMTLLEASALKVRRPAMAMAALVAGIGWTVAQNIAAGWRSGPGGAVIAAGIPLAFVLTLESLLWLLRRGRASASQHLVPATSSHDQAPDPVDTLTALRLLVESDSQRRLAAALGVPKSRVEAWSATVRPVPEPPAGDAQPDEAGGRDGSVTALGVPATASQNGHAGG
jgi:hypothetical protein